MVLSLPLAIPLRQHFANKVRNHRRHHVAIRPTPIASQRHPIGGTFQHHHLHVGPTCLTLVHAHSRGTRPDQGIPWSWQVPNTPCLEKNPHRKRMARPLGKRRSKDVRSQASRCGVHHGACPLPCRKRPLEGACHCVGGLLVPRVVTLLLRRMLGIRSLVSPHVR